MTGQAFTSHRIDDPQEFAALIAPLIEADRGRSTIVATVLHGLIAAAEPGRDPVLIAVSDGTGPIAAATAAASPAGTALVTQLVAERIVDADLAAVGTILGGVFVGLDPPPAVVTGPAEGGRAFAAGYASATGADFRLKTEMLLYQLRDLVEPIGVRGRPRIGDVADDADLELLADWRVAFAADTGGFPPVTEPDPEGVRRAAARGSTSVLWTVEGRPVSWAAHSAVVGGMARIGPVYTPPGERGHGYAAAVTSSAVRSAQRAGAVTVVLFTDAGNRTSNGVYRRIGFVERGEFAEYAIDRPAIGIVSRADPTIVSRPDPVI